MRKRYKYLIIGKTGPLGFILVGLILCFMAFICLSFEGYLVGAVLLIWGLASLVSFTGVRIDLKRMRVKHHINILGVWFGRWQSMDKYPDIVVLNKKQNMGHETYSFYSRNECSVYLMSRNHLKSIRLYRCFDRFQANDKARKLSLLLNKDYVQYNPGMQFKRVLKY